MKQELQDKAWRVLPVEFREEVKKEYAKCVAIDIDDNPNLPAYAVESAISRRALLEMLFGHHNLTSDEEGEEMLTVEKGKVQFMFDGLDSTRVNDEYDRGYKAGKEFILHGLFGPKCLPDNVDSLDSNVDSLEPKPAGPKFNLGDIVRFKYCCTTYRLDGFKMSDGVMLYQVGEVWTEESDLEPYTEPEKNIAENRNFSQDCDKHFDAILKDGFAKERRLTIAAQMMQGLICAPLIPGVDPNPPAEYLAQTAFRLADALIAEAEK